MYTQRPAPHICKYLTMKMELASCFLEYAHEHAFPVIGRARHEFRLLFFKFPRVCFNLKPGSAREQAPVFSAPPFLLTAPRGFL